MSGYFITSNWLGEPCRVRLEPDPDEVYARLLEDLEIENALMARQLKLFPRAEQGTQAALDAYIDGKIDERRMGERA